MQPTLRNGAADDFQRRRRPADADVASQIASLLEQASATSLREIDGLIGELRRRREKLIAESSRLHSAIVEYAKTSQSTLESTKSVSESLSFLHRVTDSAVPTAPETQSPSVGQEALSVIAEEAEYRPAHEAAFDQIEDREAPGSLSSEPV